MKVLANTPLRHNYAIWIMGRKPGWLKPQRYMYRCLRCKWAFIINDGGRGTIRVAADTAGLSREEELRRIATFTDGPCPGYQHETLAPQELPGNVIPLRGDNRRARSARDARAM